MAEHFIYTEGDTDRVVFEYLAAGSKVYPEKPKPCTSKDARRQGKDAIVDDAISMIRQSVPRITIALDLDNGTAGAIYRQVEHAMRDAGISYDGVDGKYTSGKTVLRVVPVGLPGHPILGEIGVASHTIDDYLVLLVLDEKVRNGLYAGKRIPSPPPVDMKLILKDSLALWRSRNIVATSSKQVLDVCCAVLCFRASPAELADGILKASPREVADTILSSLKKALE
jgi:hypothetical protein